MSTTEITLLAITASSLIFGVVCAAFASRLARTLEYVRAQLVIERRTLAAEQARTMQLQRQMRKQVEGQR